MIIQELLPNNILNVFLKYNPEEIRFVCGKPISVGINGKIFFISECGDISATAENAAVCTPNMLNLIFKKACDNSVYAYEEEIRKGFITIDGCHRIGICGKGVVKGGKLTYIKDISALNVRISHEIPGCAENIIGFVCEADKISNTLIISPPGCGKTTMLRDIARILGKKHKVGIADERSEIGGSAFDTGTLSVVMDGVPKAAAMNMMIRSMGIDVIITDEIGNDDDAEAIQNAVYSGVSVIASIHGFNSDDVKKKSGRLYSCFEKAVVLSKKHGSGTVEEMIRCL